MQSMYEISVHREFTASHAVTLQGVREEPHTHNWQVDVVVGAKELDADGVVCDFLHLDEILGKILSQFEQCDLNKTPPFDQINPTAEHVAHHIAERFMELLDVPTKVQVRKVIVIEAPGCKATYFPSEDT